MKFPNASRKKKLIASLIKLEEAQGRFAQILQKRSRKENIPLIFLSKLSDSDAENAETDVWLDFLFSCKYISDSEHQELTNVQDEVGRLIGDIIKNPEKYL